ncbi:MAG: hypothetical protein KME30_08245 [Iphinoe sp. HA4291-MV1]|nr:hypothetical protein [Iphinoe sp. HA4291-MV1]
MKIVNSQKIWHRFEGKLRHRPEGHCALHNRCLRYWAKPITPWGTAFCAITLSSQQN